MKTKAVLIFILIIHKIECQHFSNIDIKIYKDNRMITLLSADEINHETEVTDISIQGQNLTTLKEGTFTSLLQLKSVKIQDCGLEDIQNGAFNDLPSLQIINLNNNVLRRIRGGTFKNLTITKLYLVLNAITTLDQDCFHNLKYLEVLDLSQNRLKSLHSYMFNGTTSLRQVNFSFNKLEKIPHKCFLDGFINIVSGQDSYIDLSDNLLTYINEKSLEGIYNIQKLCLQNNDLQKLSHNIFDDIQIFDEINLENNNLTSLSDNILNHLKSSKNVMLSGNPWKCHFVKKFNQWCKHHNKSNTIDYYIVDECNSV